MDQSLTSSQSVERLSPFLVSAMGSLSNASALQGFTSPFRNIPPTTSSAATNEITPNNDSVMHLRQQFEARTFELQGLVEKANESLKTAMGERNAAISTAEKSSIDANGQQAEIASLKLELEACNQSVLQHSAAVTSTVAQLERVSLEVASTQTELLKTRMELDACRRELDHRMTTNASITAQLESSVKEIATSRAEVNNLKAQVEAGNRAEELAKQTIENFSQEFSRSSASLHETRSILETTKLELQRANGRISQLEQECETTKMAASHERSEHIRKLHSMKDEAISERQRMENQMADQLQAAYRTIEEEVKRRLRNVATPAGFLGTLGGIF